jgi:uncharacterized protein YraI
MYSRVILLLITIAIPLQVASAAQEPADVNLPSVPYIAEITGSNINIRSGPGMNYYRCGKLNKPDRVTVVGHKSGWSRIVPPPGSFSWISKQYLQIDPKNPTIGIVTADEVRVWAGSELVEPIHSASLQIKLNIGRTVALMGEEKSGYCKIVPPEGAYLWVSTQYTKFLNPLDDTEMKYTEPQPTYEVPVLETESAPQPKETPPTIRPPEDKLLKEYYELEKQIESERGKPVAEQDYGNIKEALTGIVNKANSHKAGRYAKFQLERINRFEIARNAGEKIQVLDRQLAQLREQIRKTGQERLAQVQDLGRFTVIGQFRPSQVYNLQSGPKRYLLLDESQKVLCYSQPADEVQDIDLNDLMNSRVGLVGWIKTDPQFSVPLVIFNQIERVITPEIK